MKLLNCSESITVSFLLNKKPSSSKRVKNFFAFCPSWVGEVRKAKVGSRANMSCKRNPTFLKTEHLHRGKATNTEIISLKVVLSSFIIFSGRIAIRLILRKGLMMYEFLNNSSSSFATFPQAETVSRKSNEFFRKSPQPGLWSRILPRTNCINAGLNCI